MRVDGKSTRRSERIKPDLPLQVRYSESAEYEWAEATRVSELTENGAGFALSRPVEPGRLIHLSFSMPRQLRAYDYHEKLYKVWAVIRYVQMVEPALFDQIRVNVGTAFVGKEPPPGFLKDPATRYDLKPILMKDGLWGAREQLRHSGRFARPVERRDSLTESIFLEIINERGEITGRDGAETQNISESGAAVLTRLTTERGRFVRLTNSQRNFSLLAVVRGFNRVKTTGASLLNLEFVTGKWPLN